ncbi:MAG TPA: lysylphosphatidylglycerol synthase transmembrane domain-containing protein [Acidimicrobiales bacterium]|nr:lysylphosphatidylglycerol synthase transmembrane domain-containing protein [Acidimicrobiales bacterium]
MPVDLAASAGPVRSEDEEDSEAPPLAEHGRRRTIVAVVAAVLLAAGVWLLIGEVANFSKLGHALQRLGPVWLTASVAGAVVGYAGYALLFQALARVADGPAVPLRLVMRLTIVVFGASVIATSAGRLGSEYWSLRKLRERPPSAWSRVLGINTALWALLAVLAWFGALDLLASPDPAVPRWLELTWLLALPGCALPAVWLTSPRRRHLTEDRGGRVRRALAAALRGIVLIRSALRRPRRGAPMVAGGIVLWGGELITVWAALRAFDYHIGYGALAIGYATGYVSTTLPLPAGGAGGVDAASAYALTLVGVPIAPALLATVIQRLCTYWLPLGVAIVAARSVKRLGPDLASLPPTWREPTSRQPAPLGGAA